MTARTARLDGGADAERGARCEAGPGAPRFLASTSVCVIRVNPTSRPAHQCAWQMSSKCIP